MNVGVGIAYKKNLILEETVSAEHRARNVFDDFFMLAQKKQRCPNWSRSLITGPEGAPLDPLVCSFLTNGQAGVGYCSMCRIEWNEGATYAFMERKNYEKYYCGEFW